MEVVAVQQPMVTPCFRFFVELGRTLGRARHPVAFACQHVGPSHLPAALAALGAIHAGLALPPRTVPDVEACRAKVKSLVGVEHAFRDVKAIGMHKAVRRLTLTHFDESNLLGAWFSSGWKWKPNLRAIAARFEIDGGWPGLDRDRPRPYPFAAQLETLVGSPVVRIPNSDRKDTALLLRGMRDSEFRRACTQVRVPELMGAGFAAAGPTLFDLLALDLTLSSETPCRSSSTACVDAVRLAVVDDWRGFRTAVAANAHAILFLWSVELNAIDVDRLDALHRHWRPTPSEKEAAMELRATLIAGTDVFGISRV